MVIKYDWKDTENQRVWLQETGLPSYYPSLSGFNVYSCVLCRLWITI